MPQSLGEIFLEQQSAPPPDPGDTPPVGDSGKTTQEAAPSSTTAAPAPGSPPIESDPIEPAAEETAPDGEEKDETPKPEEGTQPPSPPRTFKVKIDKEEIEVDEPELIKGYQLAKVSHQRIQEATERTKAINWTLEQLVTKPAEVFQQLAAKHYGSEEHAQQAWDQLCVNRVKELIHEESLSQEQRDILVERKRIEREKKEIQAHKEARAKEIQEKLDAQATERLENDVKSALKKHKLPEARLLLQMTADKLLQALDSGIAMTADEAVYEAGKEWQALVQEHTSKKPDGKAPPVRKDATEFPSTPTGEGAPPAKAGTQRTRQKRFDSVREFHKHVAESV